MLEHKYMNIYAQAWQRWPVVVWLYLCSFISVLEPASVLCLRRYTWLYMPEPDSVGLCWPGCACMDVSVCLDLHVCCIWEYVRGYIWPSLVMLAILVWLCLHGCISMLKLHVYYVWEDIHDYICPSLAYICLAIPAWLCRCAKSECVLCLKEYTWLYTSEPDCVGLCLSDYTYIAGSGWLNLHVYYV